LVEEVAFPVGRKWWTLVAVSVATFMLLLDITVVNVALPSIGEDFGASFTDLQWVLDAYALTLAALVLTAGSLADRFGRRRLFAAGLAIFSVASLLCALAPDPTFLNLARAPNATRIDWPGVATFSGALFLLVLALLRGNEEGWGSGLIVSLFVGSAVLLVAFLAIERRVRGPMLPLGLFRPPHGHFRTGFIDRRSADEGAAT
jgi:MFS family permease